MWNKDAQVTYSDDAQIIEKTFADNDEFQDAIKGEVIVEIDPAEKSENTEERKFGDIMEVYVPITFEGSNEVAGVIEVYYKMDSLNAQLNRAQRELWYFVLAATAGAILVIFVLFRSLSQSISKPLTKLKIASIEIGKGNFDVKTGIDSNDEFGDLSSTFDAMTEQLKVSTISHSEIEIKIKERTKELQAKNDEMEKFNELIVGREVKMVELKEKIKELEEKLQKK